MRKLNERKSKRFFAWLLVVTMLLSILQPAKVAFAQTNETHGGAERQMEYVHDMFDITYSCVNEWEGNRQIEVTITNTSNQPIQNWCVKYEGNGSIDTIWNAVVVSQENGSYVIKNAGYNIAINPGCSISFGYVECSSALLVPDSMELTQQLRTISDGYEVAYTIINDWSTGCQGNITIMNTGVEEIECWELAMNSYIQIENLWGADYSVDNERLVIRGFDYAPNIRAGETVNIGFIGTGNKDVETFFDGYELTSVTSCSKTIGNGTQEETTAQEPTTAVEEPTTQEPTREEMTLDYDLDSDKDGLKDYLEEQLGSDKYNSDADGDGLPDGYEVYLLGTDPLLMDSDDNGINDGEEDLDGDGVPNLYEYEHGMSSMSKDSDFDGINDFDELNVYGTNPIVADSDGDGIEDGDELELGFNPAAEDTDGDGVPDGAVRNMQEISYVFHDEPVEKVSVTMECTGYINSTTRIEDMKDIDVLSSNVVGLVGSPIDIHTDSQFDEATITFHYDKERLGEINAENLAIMWYDEENNSYVVLEDSIVDTEAGTVSYVTTHFSTYLLVDSDAWYELWRNAPDYNSDNGKYMDLVVVTDYTLKTDSKDSFADAKDIIATLKKYLLLEEGKDRCLIMNYPYENGSYELSSVKSRILTQYNAMKPAQTQDEVDRIYFLQDGKFNTEYLYEGFALDNYEHYVGFYREDYLYNEVRDTGKYLWLSEYSGDGLYERDGYVGTNPQRQLTSYSATIQLRGWLENYTKIGFCGYMYDFGRWGYLPGREILGVYLYQPEISWLDARKEGVYITDRGKEFTSYEHEMKSLTYASAINIFCNNAEALLKDIWVEGYFGESMEEKGISAALDVFENAEYTGNNRRLVYISAIDTKPIPDEIINRANALNVQIDTIYLGEVSMYDKMNIKNIPQQTGGKHYYVQSVDRLQDEFDYLLNYVKYGKTEIGKDDYDGDGIPDDYELAGLYLCNGQIVYTDPTLADTDGDGISDGEELGITGSLKVSDMVPISMLQRAITGNWKKKYGFRILSKPVEIDSDGDGYLDGIDNDYVSNQRYAKEADETPLKSSVIVTALKNEKENGQYVPVIYGGTEVTEDSPGFRRNAENPNYGGSQMWMFEKTSEAREIEKKGTDAYKDYISKMSQTEYVEFCYEKSGCGIVAINDFLMYLEYFNDIYDTRINKPISVDAEGNKYVSYVDYVYEFCQTALQNNFVCKPRYEFMNYENPSGMMDATIFMDLNNKMNYWNDKNPLSLLNVGFVGISDDDIDAIIKNQLKNNLPVILSAYKQSGYKMYDYNDQRFLWIGDDEWEGKPFAHFETITGLVEDGQSGKKYYIVSSWGRKYIVEKGMLTEELPMLESMLNGIYRIPTGTEVIR